MSVFLDASIMRDKAVDTAIKKDIQYNCIGFDFPSGLSELRLIEECRALNCLDITNPDNFDFMYDITMQLLTGKICRIVFTDDYGQKVVIAEFLVTDKFMNLRGVPLIDKYPVIVNWLVEFMTEHLSKKFPRSLEDCQATMSVKKEPSMSLKNRKSKKE